MNEYYDPDENETASLRGGRFPGLLLPPFLVLVIGLLIGLISSGIVINQSVIAESGGNIPGQSITTIIENSSSLLAGLFTPEIQYWGSEIESWSIETGLDANLIATVMQIESCGDPDATSGAGAMGLFQVMPFHFLSSDDPYIPETNALRGLAYLKKSLEASNGDVRLAFAGYNGGISVIYKSEDAWAAETQRYAYWASGIYSEASQGAGTSARLQEWLGSGGASLCSQAANRLGLNP
jgi:hypothetical protein